MKTKIFYTMIFVVGFLFAGSTYNNVSGKTPKSMTLKQDSIKYTCPMHPEVVKNKPGKCPKCGMALVVKKDTNKGMMENSKDSTQMKDTTKMKDMPM